MALMDTVHVTLRGTCLLKTDIRLGNIGSWKTMIDTIKQIVTGTLYVEQEMMSNLVKARNAEDSDPLYTHLTNKLGINDIAGLTRLAIRHGLIDA